MAWLAISAVGVFLVFVAGTQPALGNAPLGVVAHLCIGVVLAGWAVAGVRALHWRRLGSLTTPLLLATSVALVSTIASPLPRIAVAGLAGTIGVVLGYELLLCAARHPWMGPRLDVLLAALPVGVASVYLVTVATEWAEFWSLAGQVSVPPVRPAWAALSFGSPTYVAAVLVALGPFCAMYAVVRGRPIAAAMVVALGLAAIAVTGTRAALLGAGVAGVVVATLSIWRHAASGRNVIRWLLVGGTLLILAALVVSQRFGAGGIFIRLDFWETALRLFTDHPVLGAGPTTWPILGPGMTSGLDRTYAVSHAHDLYVQTLAEIGLLGTLAAAVVLAAIGRMLVRRIRMEDPRVSLPAIGALAGFFALAVQSVTDVPTMQPSVILPVVALVAAVESLPERAEGRPIDPVRFVPRRAWTIGWIAGGVVVTSAIVVSDAAWVLADRAKLAADQSDWATARALLKVAVPLDPAMPMYKQQLAIAETYGGDREHALALLDDVVASDSFPQARIARAYLLADAGRRDEALTDIRYARAHAVSDAVALMNVSNLAERLGDVELATSAAAGAIAAAPPLAASDWWKESPRNARRREIIERAAARAREVTSDEQAALVYAFAGDPRAEDALSDDDRKVLIGALIRVIAEGDHVAYRELVEHIERDPLDWYITGWLSIVTRDSDPIASRRYGQLTLEAQALSARNLLDVPRHIGFNLPGRQFRLFGSADLYGRRAPEVLFPPEAVTLAP